MGQVRILGELDVSASGNQGVNHLLTGRDGYHIIPNAMMDPLWDYGELSGSQRVAAAADGRQRGETVRRGQGEGPGSVAAHGEAGQVDA